MSAQDNPGAPRKINIAERRSLALDLRKEGWSYEQISTYLRQQQEAGELDGIPARYNRSSAYKDVIAILNELHEENRGKAAELRALETERLNEIIAAFYPRAVNGDYGAADRVMSAHDRMVKLWGLASITIRRDKESGDVEVQGDGNAAIGPQVMLYIPDNGRGDSDAERVESGPPEGAADGKGG